MPEQESKDSRTHQVYSQIFQETKGKIPSIEELQETINTTITLMTYASERFPIVHGKMENEVGQYLYKGFFPYSIENDKIGIPTSFEALGLKNQEQLPSLIKQKQLTGFALDVIVADGAPVKMSIGFYDHQEKNPSLKPFQLNALFSNGKLNNISLETSEMGSSRGSLIPDVPNGPIYKPLRQKLLQGVLYKINERLK